VSCNRLNTYWIGTPGGDFVRGFACHRNPSEQLNHWFSLATRSLWQSYDLMFGTLKLDGTAGIVIASQ
jgi:hypothetical protein